MPLISDAYRKLNDELHEREADYGGEAGGKAQLVNIIAQKVEAVSVLDYGCGKGTLKPALLSLNPALDIREYDPARPGKDSEPAPADLVACMDVMEHIEPEHLDAVLLHLRGLTLRAGLMQISLRPATRVLADGRNAHLIVEPKEFWIEKLAAHFQVHDKAVTSSQADVFFAVVTPRH